MVNEKARVLIMAGGTGGHIFPALAVARELQKKGHPVAWLGTRNGLESQILSKTDIPLHYISIAGLRRKGFLAYLSFPFRLLIAFFQSIRILREIKPQVVLGMGGFVAGPGGLASVVLGIPLVIHEQNSIAGLTNRLLSRLASRVLESFPNSFPKTTPTLYTGLPIRQDLLSLSPPDARLKTSPSRRARVLVLGGSRGAVILNQTCPAAFQLLPEAWRPEIWHQTGKGGDELTRSHYASAKVLARIEPFIENMSEAYAWADLVICRSGASTVTELMTVGIASILIPFPFAVDDHQRHNAHFLEKEGAAILLEQSHLEPQRLANFVFDLTQDRERLIKMSERALKLAKRNALAEVVDQCIGVIQWPKK